VLRRFRPRLSYANVMVTILAFIVLGGGAYAAFHLPRNSVRSRNIVNGQVKPADTSKALGFKCPSKTRYFEGACIETKARASANWFDALKTCTDAGRRLASVSELDGFRLEPHISLVGFEWTSEYASAATTTDDTKLGVVSEDQNDYDVITNSHAYRCVARAKH
jgi:hypothetical protein